MTCGAIAEKVAQFRANEVSTDTDVELAVEMIEKYEARNREAKGMRDMCKSALKAKAREDQKGMNAVPKQLGRRPRGGAGGEVDVFVLYEGSGTACARTYLISY
jgi:hypothetical protein